MNKIVVSNHAQLQLKERDLSRALVEEVLRKPDQIIEGQFGRKIAQRVIRQGKVPWLFRVVYVQEGDKLVVVTVYRTTKISKYLAR